MRDTTEPKMEHDTEDGPGGDTPDREEECMEELTQILKKSLGEIPLTQKGQRLNNHTRRYKGGILSTLDLYINAKGFTSIYMKGEELRSIPYYYFDSCTSRPSHPPSYISLCLCPAIATAYLHYALSQSHY